jgi:hypothetical protein
MGAYQKSEWVCCVPVADGCRTLELLATFLRQSIVIGLHKHHTLVTCS